MQEGRDGIVRMEQKVKQSIRPYMIQSARVLQLNTAELHQYLQELSLENPLLDFAAPPAQPERQRELPRCADEQNPVYERQEWENAHDLWNFIPADVNTLTDALIFQLNGLGLDSRQRRIVKYMINNLESNGYLSIPLEDVGHVFGCGEKEVTELLEILQTMEPCGVGARSLSECLCIQLRKRYPEERTALAIAQDGLELLGKNQLPMLARKLRKTIEEIRDACSLIRSLNPRPGAAFGNGREMHYIYPELLVFQSGNSSQVMLNEYHAPCVYINGDYLLLLNDCDSPEIVEYLTKKKEQLEWVQQCIAQRNQTLLDLGSLILEVQKDFFLNGPGYLQTFTQAQAAKRLGLHESTVSRALREKYLQCIWGTFPLNHFFPQGMQQRDSICRRIRQLIAQEDKRHPLNDQIISQMLAREGMSLSKRMVSKYRRGMGIPDAHSRKEFCGDGK